MLILSSKYLHSYRWWIAYRDAVSFRSSHYFVCFLSEASAIMSGFGHHEDEPWSLSVARPQFIEIPRSLVQVVVYWNMPMHNWLKNCEYVDSFSYKT
jgi:porcupine-like protein